MSAQDRPRPGPGPVAGLKVLDFTQIFAGPFCTTNLADLGADVLRVETHSRTNEDAVRGLHFRNKRSITLDLKNEAGQAVALRLAMVSDVVIENFSAGVMHRLGLDYEAVAPGNPHLIFVSMAGYGQTGPRRSWTSMNSNLQAYTGLMLTTGAEGDPPISITNAWNDYIGGLHAVIAVLVAVGERETTGRGRNIDLAQFECSVATLGPLLMAAAVNGTPSRRWGSRSSRSAPQGVYPCAGEDEWCAISVDTAEQWHRLAQAIGQPSLADDPRFGNVIGRMRHHDELDRAIAQWTGQLAPTEVEERLKRLGVPAERMRRGRDIAESPNSGLGYRRFSVPGGGSRTSLAPSVPFTLSESSVAEFTPPGALGEHTREALRDWLGMDDARIDDLEAEGALV